MKDIRVKCFTCRARHRSRFMITITRDFDYDYCYGYFSIVPHHICHACACEYRKIFYGNKKREARDKNPLIIDDYVQELKPLEIPEQVQSYYDVMIAPFNWAESKERKKKELDEFLKKLGEEDEISEAP